MSAHAKEPRRGVVFIEPAALEALTRDTTDSSPYPASTDDGSSPGWSAHDLEMADEIYRRWE